MQSSVIGAELPGEALIIFFDHKDPCQHLTSRRGTYSEMFSSAS